MTFRPPVALSAGALAAALAGNALAANVERVPAGLQFAAPPVSLQAGPSLPSGNVQVVVRLSDPSLAAKLGPNARKNPSVFRSFDQRAYLAQLKSKQDALMTQVRALGGRELARVSKAHNAVAVEIAAARVADVARLPGVSKVRAVVDYRIDLTETVPYVGATTLQNAGYTGTGVRVAVLDSGVDYTHRNLGGAGTDAAYVAAYGASGAAPENKSRDGLFPTAKVVDGYDFVGEVWPNGPLAPDPDPIDIGGHGTHVADIIAGKSLDGTHKGVAPDAKIVAVKVCSAVSTSCSGVALLQGMDFALDPNGDGDLSDAVDVVNMSLGTPYGQREDDLSEASSIAARFGVVVVASAGNEADRPYITGSPASTPEVISVAQTQVPSAIAIPLIVSQPPSIAGTYSNTATLSWAPVTSDITGNVVYVGRGCAVPPDVYLADPAGKIALIDRGTCNISEKVDRAANAGAIATLIANNAPGDAPSFSQGNGSNFVPSLVVSQAIGNVLKTALVSGTPVSASFGPSNTVALAGSMVASSARGPNFSYSMIKPDIGAPGGSVSAVAGGATEEQAFSGTSGAAPMVSGAAALLVQKFPTAAVNEIKARLMNAAETTIYTNPATQPGVLAPITRIGGGELRVDRSAVLTAAAWDAADPFAVGLSFGYNAAAAGTTTLSKKVSVRNYAGASRTFRITPSFRYANDATSGAVTLSAPATITVPANATGTFTMTARINGAALPNWGLTVGSNGGTGALLQNNEFDGYVTIDDATDSLHLPWHVLPHKVAAMKASSTSVALSGGSGSVTLSNVGGATQGVIDTFSLLGTSPRIPQAQLPQPGDNAAVIDLKAVGVRTVDVGNGEFALQAGINTWGHRAHAVYPAEFDVYIDVNDDGVPDFVMFTSELTAFATTGQTVVTLVNLDSGSGTTKFYAAGNLDSANIIMTVLMSDLGVTPNTKLRFWFYAFDNYFTGALTDAIEDLVYTPATPRYTAAIPSAAALGPGGVAGVPITAVTGGAAASPSQLGLLFLYQDAKPGAEADAVVVTGN